MDLKNNQSTLGQLCGGHINIKTSVSKYVVDVHREYLSFFFCSCVGIEVQLVSAGSWRVSMFVRCVSIEVFH